MDISMVTKLPVCIRIALLPLMVGLLGASSTFEKIICSDIWYADGPFRPTPFTPQLIKDELNQSFSYLLNHNKTYEFLKRHFIKAHKIMAMDGYVLRRQVLEMIALVLYCKIPENKRDSLSSLKADEFVNLFDSTLSKPDSFTPSKQAVYNTVLFQNVVFINPFPIRVFNIFPMNHRTRTLHFKSTPGLLFKHEEGSGVNMIETFILEDYYGDDLIPLYALDCITTLRLINCRIDRLTGSKYTVPNTRQEMILRPWSFLKRVELVRCKIANYVDNEFLNVLPADVTIAVYGERVMGNEPADVPETDSRGNSKVDRPVRQIEYDTVCTFSKNHFQDFRLAYPNCTFQQMAEFRGFKLVPVPRPPKNPVDDDGNEVSSQEGPSTFRGRR